MNKTTIRCRRPDVDEWQLLCGHPIPCPHHDTRPQETRGLWRGKPVEQMSREELIDALIEQAALYRDALKSNRERP